MDKEIGFVGLGNMGRPMAANLIKAGFKLKVYNRTPAKAEELVAAGAQLVDSAAETVSAGGIVITMVANDQALEEVVWGPGGFGDKLGPNGVHLSMSTVAPETTRRMAAQHKDRGSYYVASPVFGRPEAAAAQKLFVLSAGTEAARQRVRPLQDAMGQRVFDLGKEPAAANVIKVGGNFMIMAAMEAMAEAFTLAEKAGIERQVAADIYASTLFACTVYQGYGKLIANQTYEPAGFRLALGYKDCGLVLNEAGLTRTPMPLASLLRDRLLASIAKGRENQDWAALARLVSEEAGL